MTPYLFLDARYEKARVEGVVRDVAILSAIGVGEDCKRTLLGVSVSLSEAEVHWRSFLDSLVNRGLRGVGFIVSDDHAGLGAARRAVFGGVVWQRCQFHLAQNAIHHAPTQAIRKAIGSQLRAVWNAKDLPAAQQELKLLVQSYAKTAPTSADGWRPTFPKASLSSSCLKAIASKCELPTPSKGPSNRNSSEEPSKSASSPRLTLSCAS